MESRSKSKYGVNVTKRVNLSRMAFADFVILFGDRKDVMEAAEQRVQAVTDVDMWQLTIGDLGQYLQGEYPTSLADRFDASKSVAEYLGTFKALREFVGKFVKLLARFTVKATADELQASAGLPKFDETEGLLVFAREYFGLPSFDAAEKVTLGELYLAKKDDYIKTMAQRNLQRIQAQKMKMKK